MTARPEQPSLLEVEEPNDADEQADAAYLRRTETPKLCAASTSDIIDLFSGCGGMTLGALEGAARSDREARLALAIDNESLRAGSRGGSLVAKQLANAQERLLNVRRVLLEVGLKSTQELGERSRIEPLHPVCLFTCFSLRLLERRFELTHASFQGLCRVTEQPPEKAEAPTEIYDDLATRLREGHGLISSRVRLRSVYEVEIGEEGSDGSGSGGCRHRYRDRGCGGGGGNQRHRACCGRWRSGFVRREAVRTPAIEKELRLPRIGA